MTKKKHIDTYSSIYPVDLVVANETVTLKDLQKQYSYDNEEELTEDIIDGLASTSRCRDKNTGKYVILVKYNHNTTVKGDDKRLCFINTISHEAVHVAMDIYSFVGEKVYPNDENELLAYLIGWITQCIYKTLTKK